MHKVKERMILCVNYSDYTSNKDEYDKLIHDGYSLAVVIDDDVKGNMVLLNVFTYIIIDYEKYQSKFEDFDNVIMR